jgi:hypothetical protein
MAVRPTRPIHALVPLPWRCISLGHQPNPYGILYAPDTRRHG